MGNDERVWSFLWCLFKNEFIHIQKHISIFNKILYRYVFIMIIMGYVYE